MCTNKYQKYIQEYFSEFIIKPFDVNIVETKDMDREFYIVRPDQIGKNNRKDGNYHGFCVPPQSLVGNFTLLLDKHYMEKSKKEDYEWVGTIIHETTHANDYIQFQKIINANSYDELFDLNKYRVFSFWTEFHARAMGQNYIIKYRKKNNHEFAGEDYVINTEFPKVIDWYNTYTEDTSDRLLELLATLLGMLYAWELNYPISFSQQSVRDLFIESNDLYDLYLFLREYITIDKAALHFDELHRLLKTLYPAMP